MKDRYRIKCTVTHPDPPLPPRPIKAFEININIKETEELKIVIDKAISQYYSEKLEKILNEVSKLF